MSKAEQREACERFLLETLKESGLPDESQGKIIEQFTERDGDEAVTMIFKDKDLHAAIKKEKSVIESAQQKEKETSMKLVYGEDLTKRIKNGDIEVDKKSEAYIREAIAQAQGEEKPRVGQSPVVVSFASKKDDFVVVLHDAKSGHVKVTVSK